MMPPGWDHDQRCMDRDDAFQKRDELRERIGWLVGGKVVRWRVRPCRVCGSYYVDREARKQDAA
jgi:hypothetical protein